ncbi:tRNA lysidine(34) synthetase TilS [Sphingomonas sp. NBWT7]|uniref:tRNA lysidine(34) synthetase TilS n=1 Tax=Sphingomonas sp. NBWT7 TaxID=2596913 RepID=UPI001629F30C|nr:tRNA lysidine(34) synthetase TilS [Sphingomonas sp. NBWT7]QNE33133.1 tRNA lysidine(34) synthetase TilS [Sphingomonas sp. NBWT7]
MIDAADVARFRDDVLALIDTPLGPAAPLGLAVSGGPDSMALLLLARAAFPGAVAAASVDHGLRAGNADEARMVAREAAALGVPHAILGIDGELVGASLQARARGARYASLARWADAAGAVAIATAHHADDQAETFLMRASRGSGVTGLSAIRPRAVVAGAQLVRPLLGWRRAALRAIVRRAGAAFVDDPSNADPRHDRTRFRRLLDQNEWLDPPALARTAGAIGEAERDLAALADLLWAERATIGDASVAIDVAGLPRDTRRRHVRRAIALVRDGAAIATPAFDAGANVEALIDALDGGHRATQAGVIGSPRQGRWHFRAAPPRRSL